MNWYSPFRIMDSVLRHNPTGVLPSLGPRKVELSWRVVLGVVMANGVFYGAAMGSQGWIVGARSLNEQYLQMLYSAIKVPLLLGVTTLVAIPSFFVLNTLSGLRDDFRTVLRSIFTVQAGMTVILASLAPITLFVYVSSPATQIAYRAAVLLNAVIFGIASISAQLLLRVYYRPLIARNPLHRRMLWVWIGLYAFIGIQCGWALRPFIGGHQVEVAFFRPEKFGNAYIKIWDLVRNVIEGVI